MKHKNEKNKSECENAIIVESPQPTKYSVARRAGKILIAGRENADTDVVQD